MDLPVLNEPIWVDEPQALHRMVTKLAAEPILGVDTESNSLHAYKEQVCLIQFSTPQDDYLVDPLALTDLSPLGPIFANPGIEKVFHAAEYDIICLKRDFSFQFANLFDTMIAGRILGRMAVGLGAMLEAEFGILLDKHFQRANWGQRPLPPAQLAYARLDTHYLILLRERLRQELIDNGRWPLAQEDYQRLTLTNGHAPVAGLAESTWRISGVQDLTPQQAAILHELNAFRDQVARTSNHPPFKVLSNQVLLRLAQEAPRRLEDLKGIDELNPRQVQRFGYGLLRAVRRGLSAHPLTRPVSPRPDEKILERLEALRSWRKQAAQAMGVESDVVLPRDLLQELATRAPRDPGELRLVMQQTPWRYEHFGLEIARVLSIEAPR